MIINQIYQTNQNKRDQPNYLAASIASEHQISFRLGINASN